jgi:hypothetical protein
MEHDGKLVIDMSILSREEFNIKNVLDQKQSVENAVACHTAPLILVRLHLGQHALPASLNVCTIWPLWLLILLWMRRSLRRQFFSADSACVDIYLAQAQPAKANF